MWLRGLLTSAGHIHNMDAYLLNTWSLIVPHGQHSPAPPSEITWLDYIRLLDAVRCSSLFLFVIQGKAGNPNRRLFAALFRDLHSKEQTLTDFPLCHLHTSALLPLLQKTDHVRGKVLPCAEILQLFAFVFFALGCQMCQLSPWDLGVNSICGSLSSSDRRTCFHWQPLKTSLHFRTV